MFSSATTNERWSVPFDPSPSTSTVTTPPLLPGRKRKANFSNDETETLVWNVVRHFGALYGSESFRAPPVRRKQLWTQIQNRVNFLGYTERSIDDLKHKWRDLRLDVKKKITSKKPPTLHQTGPPCKPRLTPLEKMVASTLLQPTHDSEPEIVLKQIFFPGASRQTSCSMEPASSPKGQPSTLPEMEGWITSRLGVRSPEPSLMGDYSSSGDSGSELRVPKASTISPKLRSDSLVSCISEEEDVEDPDGDDGLDQPLSAEEGLAFSTHQAMLLRRSSSQGSLASVPEDTLSQAAGHAEWGHSGGADLGLGSREGESRAPKADLGCSPQGPMGPAWEKWPRDNQRPQFSRTPLRAASLNEESLSVASPHTDHVSPSHSVPQGIGGARPPESRRESLRTTLHRLTEMEDQWDQLYHHELAMWQEERAQQREERARDRDLQLRLLDVLAEIRDELRSLRQERAASRQEHASQTGAALTSPLFLSREPDASFPKPSSDSLPPFYPVKTESCRTGPALNGGRGERGVGLRSPRGIPRRGRGRPRGSTSRHKRLCVSNH